MRPRPARSRPVARTFGQTVRALREDKGIGLRELARRLSISPTYLTQIEKDSCPKPTEERVVAIAHALDQDPDTLLALAGRVASDLGEIIRSRPQTMASFLRVARALSEDELRRITDQMRSDQ